MKTPNQTKTSEVIELPNKVFNANWRDDVPEELADEENEMAFEVYSDEKNYQSPEEVTAKAERRYSAAQTISTSIIKYKASGYRIINAL